MPFDGIVTKAVIEELQTLLVPGRVTKLYQPSPTEIVLTVRSNRKTHTLLLSIHPTYARLHVTQDSYRNPQGEGGNPPPFCMLLRKHLTGAIIESIEQDGMERIVTFKMRTVNEIGDSSHKFLIIELMGRHSNLMLLNENQEHIIDSLKHVPPTKNRHRIILPGFEYISPPSQEKVNPLEIDGDDFIQKLDFNAGKLDRQIVNILDGISPLLAQEITVRAGLGSPKNYKEQFLSVQDDINNRVYKPTIYYGKKEDFHVIDMRSFNGERREFETVNDMLDQFYSGKAERDRVKQQAKDLHRFIKNELDKNVRKMGIHQKTLKKAQNADKYQRLGELLTAHMHLISKGDSSVTVVDYYDPDQNQVIIELNPNKTPSENAQALFTIYRKLVNSKRKVKEEMDKTQNEITYLEQLLQQLDIAREMDIEDIREELREEGYLKRQKRTKRNKRHITPTPETYTSTEGVLIYVGKNNKQNEHITTRLARRNDIWLHTKDIPGSHVLIREENPDDKTLQEAAQLAAYFSKAQQSSTVPVDYTLIRHVKKPKGSRPGFVTYDNQKTLYVTPDETLVERLKNK